MAIKHYPANVFDLKMMSFYYVAAEQPEKCCCFLFRAKNVVCLRVLCLLYFFQMYSRIILPLK